MKKSTALIAAATAAAALVLSGCTNAPEDTPTETGSGFVDNIHSPMKCDASPTTDELLASETTKADSEFTIAVLLVSLSGYYYQGVAYGAEKAGEESGANVTVYAGEGFSSPEQQLSQAQTAIQQGADAIVLQPVDPRGSLPILEATKAAGIPLIVFGTELASSEQDAMIIQDDYALGQAGADELAALHPEGGEGVLIAGPATATWSLKRAAGFTDRLTEEYPEFTIAAAPTQVVDPAQGLQDFTAAAQANPDVSWVYSVFFYQLLPDSLPAQYAGLPFVTTGYEPAAISSLENGSLDVTAQLGNIWFGYEPVNQAVTLLNGDSVPKVTCLPFDKYTKDDIGSPSAEAEIYPSEFVAK